MRDFELILPAYNESKNLPGLVRRAVVEARATGNTPDSFQLVIVNNGSRDDTAQALDNLKKEWGDWFRVVTVEQNRGYGHGVMEGLRTSNARFIGWSHSDQQCDPKDAFDALSLSKSEPNVLAKGFRVGRARADRFVTHIFELLARIFLGIKLKEINAQPKVFPAALLAEISNPPVHFGLDLYVLYRAIKANYQVRTLRVKCLPRIHGLSNWSSNFFSRYKTIAKMIGYMLSLLKSEGRV